MNEDLLLLWLEAFLSTVLVETPIYMLFLQPRLRLELGALVSLGLQMATHPVLWILWPHLPHDIVSYPLMVVILEVSVTLLEGALLLVVLGTRDWRRALLASLVANTTSTVVGLLLH